MLQTQCSRSAVCNALHTLAAVFCNTYKLRAGMYLALYRDSLKRLVSGRVHSVQCMHCRRRMGQQCVRRKGQQCVRMSAPRWLTR